MCPPMRAHWRNLANTIEHVLPLAYPSPQPKRQIDRFSHFCTAHGTVLSGMPGHVLSPNNCPFPRGIWTASNICYLGPTRVHNPNGISIGSAVFVCRASVYFEDVPIPSKLPPSHEDLDPYLIHGSFGPRKSSIQTASRLVEPFCRAH